VVDGRDGLHTGTGQERFKEGAKSKVEGSEAFFTGTARDRGANRQNKKHLYDMYLLFHTATWVASPPHLW